MKEWSKDCWNGAVHCIPMKICTLQLQVLLSLIKDQQPTAADELGSGKPHIINPKSNKCQLKASKKEMETEHKP